MGGARKSSAETMASHFVVENGDIVPQGLFCFPWRLILARSAWRTKNLLGTRSKELMGSMVTAIDVFLRWPMLAPGAMVSRSLGGG